MRQFISDLFTGPDGKTWSIGRCAALPSLVAMIAVPFFALCKGQTISFTDLGIYWGGCGTLFMAQVAGTNFTEPKAVPSTSKTDDKPEGDHDGA